ncbi:hypothetical protein Dde_1687 [Oleidesulfovibrio alaskensis G20]|jgi:ferredoxin|uniref:4Fe-4S ferredoxin-type domain-containing protein n=1 Tax=Oleidesulfovibrio alaskensis (strain ATCC BAA-1058 / DSM 17464 / G20) TaxID=207559 RepID=Q311B2_OLEA2|nr:hypothetical protein [Oleidesulfovibrio alaskensis]ABB38484.1 hypothetical protein Dde_1687 [Oleidesulfovibrio alaskensis G20]MBG0773503.1 ferredoxin [Oleidesulfovibrio alaskensis]MBL3583293.1 ferredoxin [Oleidesulfovibrio alaskensis]
MGSERHDTDKDFSLITAGCSGCRACVELAPDHVAWVEGDERPMLLSDVAPDAVVAELIAFCPEDCFEYDE